MGIGGDPYWANVVLLLNCEGSNGGTTFTDSSSKNKSPNVTTNCTTSTDQAKFGSSCLKFGTTTAFLGYAADADFAMGTGNFTIEMFVYPLVANVNGDFYAIGTYNDGGDQSLVVRTVPDCEFYGAGSVDRINNGGTQPTANQWNHVAVVNTGGTLQFFINGVSQGTTARTVNYTDNTLKIGYAAVETQYAAIYVDAVRITKAVSRYPSGFTPPATPYPLGPGIPPFSRLRTHLRR